MGMVEFSWQQSQDEAWGLCRLQQRGTGNPLEIPAAGTGSCCYPQADNSTELFKPIKSEKWKQGRFCIELPWVENAALGAPVAGVSPGGVTEPFVPPPTWTVLVYKWSGWCWLSICLLSHPARNVPPECPGSSYFRRKPLFFFFPLRLTKPPSVLLCSAVKAKVYKKGNYSLTFNCN